MKSYRKEMWFEAKQRRQIFNITAEIELTQRSEVLKKELSLFVDNADGFALCLLDDDGRVTIWNAGAERLSGWSEAEAVGQMYGFLLDADDQARGVAEWPIDVARRVEPTDRGDRPCCVVHERTTAGPNVGSP